MNRSRDDSSSSSVSVASSNGGKSKRNKSVHAKNSNPNTVEKVRMIMEKEGRSARNLVSWSIPLDSYGPSKGKPSKAKPVNLHRKHLPREELTERTRCTSDDVPSKKLGSNPNRSSSTGSRKPVNIRARYWAYLFENLRRAVDEIYATCEGDASVVECKEVLLILDNYHHEFQALIDWINLQEKLENTDIHDRPTSLAWEVRKSSPGRPRQKMRQRGVPPGSVNSSTSSKISRRPAPKASPLLNGVAEDKPAQSPTTTWADRVKGIKPLPTSNKPFAEVKNPSTLNGIAEENESKEQTTDDDGDWETVTSKNKQPKHLKVVNEKKHTIKIDTSSKSGATTNYSLSKLDSVSETTASPNSYVNIVVDRIIGLEGMGNQPTGAPNQSPSAAPIQSSSKPASGCVSLPVKTSEKQEKTASKKALFRPEATKSESEECVKTDDKEQREDESLAEENNLTLKKLEEEAALLARTLHAEHDASIAVAEEQERDLLRQIQEAKDQDTPELDTDCESARSSAGAKELPLLEQLSQPMEWAEFVARFEAEQAAGLSWNELVEEEELREPGRAVQMHEKLSSPSRKRTPAESRRKQEEKHRRAELRRQQMHQEKAQKIHELTEKVQEVINWKNDLIKRQRDLLQSCHTEKLARAEEQRAIQLLNIKKKAQVEDTKVNEIAFINVLQEQNKRHEVLMRIEEHESRIQELEQERTKMLELKSVKEETVKERQRALEKERLDRIEELKVKRKEQIARVEQQQIEKVKEREKLAKERARDREMRLSALNAAQQEAVSELQKKIQLKHNESERRHQVQLEQRKEKALELSLGRFSLSTSSTSAQLLAATAVSSPGVGATSKTLNSGANAVSENKIHMNGNGVGKLIDDKHSISSDSMISPRSVQSHVDEEPAEDFSSIAERKKMMKKRMKKLRSRMNTRGKEFLTRLENKVNPTPATNKNKIVRLIKDLIRLLANQKDCRGPWPTNRVSALDRALGEISRSMEKQAPGSREQELFRNGGGFSVLDDLFLIFLKEEEGRELGKKISILPNKSRRPTFGLQSMVRETLHQEIMAAHIELSYLDWRLSKTSTKSLSNVALVFRNACRGCYDNCVYALYSSKLTALVDVAYSQISKIAVGASASGRVVSQKKDDSGVVCDVASPLLLSALSVVLFEICKSPPTDEKKFSSLLTLTSPSNVLEGYLNRGIDVISYVVASGIIDLLSSSFKSIRHEVAPGSNLSCFIEHGLSFLESLTMFIAIRNRLLPSRAICCKPVKKPSEDDKGEPSALPPGLDTDPTQLLATLKQTDIMGIVSVLYGLLLHGAPERPTILRSASVQNSLGSVTSSEPKQIPKHILSVAFAVLSVLNAVAEMDLPLLQASLMVEDLSLAFRHICTYLLWYCVQGDHSNLLHEVIRCVGHFTLDNRCNQDLMDSGAQPTVLQQLCTLPFSYFSNPPMMHILLPTLIACCYDNDSSLAVFEQEASSSMLVEFIQTLDEAIGDSIVKRTNKRGSLPRSLADIPPFNSDFLQRALTYFDVKRDVTSS